MTLNLTPRAHTSASHDDCLVLRDITVAYDRHVVLRGVSADIERGQVIGVIGPNGGGKSTLLKAILGIVPLVGGTVSLFGQPASKSRRRMACVPQREVVDWDFPVSVHDVVLMGRYPHMGMLRRASQADRDAVESALRRVDMLDHTQTQIGRLSGGQQQRVFIARALAQEADLLLLDEPMTGIDASTQELILQVIEEERQRGKIVLLATHDLASASCACDCLCCVNERMVSYGSVEDTYTAENMAETFGGPVIVLGPTGTPPLTHSHHADDAAHHQHHHENMGRDHA